MNTNIKNKGGRRFAPWTASLALALFATIVLVAPAMVFAQVTGQLSQDCDFALIGNEHTITATVTEGGVPYTGNSVFFWVESPGNVVEPYFLKPNFVEDGNGIATFPHTVNSVRQVTVKLYTVDGNLNWIELNNITTTWTDNEADLCSDAPGVTVGGRVTLNDKKNGTFRIALCSVDGLDVNNVDLQAVRLAGVAPLQSKYKDSRLCPGGKDGVGDLVFKFKNRDVVEALENGLGELEDGQEVGLALTGSLKDGTSFEGEWLAVIYKEDKRHKKEKHHEKKKCGEKKGKKDKLAKN